MIDVDPAFLAFLQSEETRAYDGTLLEEVETAIDSYNGAPYGDEEDGRSQVVARDVAETADYMLTSVLEVFVASGRVVEFEPNGEQGEQTADDVTEALHYLYRKKSGYRFIHDWAKGGLLEKVGIAKTVVEKKTKRVEREIPSMLLPGTTEDELKESGVIEAQETDPVDDGQGNSIGMHRIVTLEEMAAEFRDYWVPLEEFRVSPDARDLDSAVYLCHITEKSLSDLVEMGFDPEAISDSQGNNPFITALASARNDGRANWIGSDNRSGTNRKVWLNEEYVLFDLDGDGISERLCVQRVGSTILKVEAVDYQPFEYWCPYPMQGRLIGQSLADKTMDIQRVNTVLERLMLDSAYQQIAPGTFLNEDSAGDHTLDDLLTVRPGRIIRWKGSIEPKPEVRPDISATALNIMEFKVRQRESRTGITRLNKGVDEDTLNDTARGQAQLMSRGQQMERYIVRNFAEGVARLFMRKVALLRKYGQPFQIRVDGQYRQVDPSQWPEEMEVNVKVGLGSGSKEDRIMARQALGQVQSMLKEIGSQIVSDDNVFNNCIGLARDYGLQPNDLFTEPPKDQNGQPIPQQPPPDPKAQALMAQVQMKQQQIQQSQEEGQAKLQMMAQKHASDEQIATAKAQLEAEIAVRQQNLQTWLQTQQMALETAKHVHSMSIQHEQSKAKISQMRQGGALNK
jgi:hypothetical protein